MNLIKKIIPGKYKRKIKEDLGVPSLHWSLENLKKSGFNPSVIIDIGAYEGYWTLDTLEVFPSAKIIMVEAQQKKKTALQKVVAKHPNTEYCVALLSSTTGNEKFFLECETGSHVVDDTKAAEGIYKLKTETLDNLLALQGFPLPDFIKLDVQGYELEVLKGAEKAMTHAEICLLEISLMDIGGQTPLLAEMVSYMNDKDFQAYDISQLMRRPLDKALYQVDMFFVKKNSDLLINKGWK
jgi:FkbM family methyltransferase